MTSQLDPWQRPDRFPSDDYFAERMNSGRPVIVVDPAVRLGHPTIRGVSTLDIAATVAADSVAVACEEYGLTRGEVLLACWFEGTWGRRRDAWGEWADGQAFKPLTRGGQDTTRIPDPPRAGDGT